MMDLELHIENDEAVHLAHELATLKGETVEAAVLAALRERFEREQARTAQVDRIMAMAREARAHMREPVSSDHSDLYDEQGLPR